VAWHTANRDQAGIAKEPADGKDIPEVYGLGRDIKEGICMQGKKKGTDDEKQPMQICGSIPYLS